jgi:ornithine decarboxylase
MKLYCLLLQAEIQKVLDQKVPASRIIYANPCKQSSFIQYAAKHNVELMTFDNETELHKVKANHPNAK